MALHAAKASWAAQQQGKFWEMHDVLFSARGQLDPLIIRAQAESIGLDMGKFDEDLASPQAGKAVFADRRAGQESRHQGNTLVLRERPILRREPASGREGHRDTAWRRRSGQGLRRLLRGGGLAPAPPCGHL